ncbi:MAG TPA: hypothetical protein VJT11_12435 [Nitrospiraceae bacterium]|nr:hypothetical protein [Nitrospiraceae bacterium]
MPNFSQGRVYEEKAFCSLLKSESKRSESSGHFCQIFLLYRTDVKGRIAQMDPHIATIVIGALARSLRETDYIGWYRADRVIGAVLTVLTLESMAHVASHLQKRLAEILQSELSVEESRRLQIRVFLPGELEGFELEEKAVSLG